MNSVGIQTHNADIKRHWCESLLYLYYNKCSELLSLIETNINFFGMVIATIFAHFILSMQ